MHVLPLPFHLSLVVQLDLLNPLLKPTPLTELAPAFLLGETLLLQLALNLEQLSPQLVVFECQLLYLVRQLVYP